MAVADLQTRQDIKAGTNVAEAASANGLAGAVQTIMERSKARDELIKQLSVD